MSTIFRVLEKSTSSLKLIFCILQIIFGIKRWQTSIDVHVFSYSVHSGVYDYYHPVPILFLFLIFRVCLSLSFHGFYIVPKDTQMDENDLSDLSRKWTKTHFKHPQAATTTSLGVHHGLPVVAITTCFCNVLQQSRAISRVVKIQSWVSPIFYHTKNERIQTFKKTRRCIMKISCNLNVT